MVAAVLRNHWRVSVPLHRGATPGEVLGFIGWLVIILMMGVPYAGAVCLTAGMTVEMRGAATTAQGASLLAAWIVIPLMVSGQSQFTDASRYAVFPLRGRELLRALLAVALIGPGGVVALLLCLTHAVAWHDGGPMVVLASVIGLLLGWVTVLVVGQLVLLGLSAIVSRRRVRETIGLVAVIFMVVGMLLVQHLGDHVPVPTMTGRILGWTPVAWCWSVPWEVATGRWWAAGVKLFCSVGLVALMLWGWAVLVARRLVSPAGNEGSAERVHGSNPIDRLLPATVTGAIVGRTLRTMRRDPRMVSMFVSTFLIPIIVVMPMLFHPGEGAEARVATMLPFVIFVLASPGSAANLISYDGTALWHHIVASVRGIEDRRGRAIGFLVVIIPAVILMAVAVTWRAGQWRMLPASIGVAVGSMMIATGIGSWLGAVNPVRMPESRKGGGFASSSGFETAGCISALASMAIGGVLAIPVAVPAIFTIVKADVSWLPYLTLLVALVWSWLVLHVGIVLGGRVLDRNWLTVMERIRPKM